MNQEPVRALLITRSEDERELYSLGLRGFGIGVTTARDAEEGTFIAGIREFDVLVLAVVAPRADGWRECEILRRHPATSGLPLIALSASLREDRANREHARRIGCAAFVGLPCLPEHLSIILRRVLSGEPYIEYVGLQSREHC